MATNVIGASVETQDYTAFGEDNVMANHSKDRYGFTGRERIRMNGMYNNRNRIMDTLNSIFTQRDPLYCDPNPTGNLYVYANANPVFYIDPSGEGPLDYIAAWSVCAAYIPTWKNLCEAYLPDCTGNLGADELVDCITNRNAAFEQCAKDADGLFKACMKAAGKFLFK